MISQPKVFRVHLPSSYLNSKTNMIFSNSQTRLHLYYRVEDIISTAVNLEDLENGGVYYPKSGIVREKADTLNAAITEAKGEEYASKKSD